MKLIIFIVVLLYDIALGERFLTFNAALSRVSVEYIRQFTFFKKAIHKMLVYKFGIICRVSELIFAKT